MSYFIKRIRFNGPTTVVASDLTLDEAIAKAKGSVGAFWFDTYVSTDNDNPSDYKREAHS
jgi:hypothetical protein